MIEQWGIITIDSDDVYQQFPIVFSVKPSVSCAYITNFTPGDSGQHPKSVTTEGVTMRYKHNGESIDWYAKGY